ncbi:hypothetical protein ACJIZ3_022027 [Penstemon smallii]|uniref:Uncharacterized protein n=1 Tax=Penstemon smallii TaxID=265156 RepID=A0ABD3SNC5_9LAMI
MVVYSNELLFIGLPTYFDWQPKILIYLDLTFQASCYNYHTPCRGLNSLASMVTMPYAIKQGPRRRPRIGGKCLLLLVVPIKLSSLVGELPMDCPNGALKRLECLLECSSTNGGSVLILPGHGIATATSLHYLAIRSVASSSNHLMDIYPVNYLSIRRTFQNCTNHRMNQCSTS